MASVRVDQILAAIRGLPPAERREIIARATRDLAVPAEPSDPLAFIGMFAAEPDLIDAICEDAMRARERDPLRLPSG